MKRRLLFIADTYFYKVMTIWSEKILGWLTNAFWKKPSSFKSTRMWKSMSMIFWLNYLTQQTTLSICKRRSRWSSTQLGVPSRLLQGNFSDFKGNWGESGKHCCHCFKYWPIWTIYCSIYYFEGFVVTTWKLNIG